MEFLRKRERGRGVGGGQPFSNLVEEKKASLFAKEKKRIFPRGGREGLAFCC